MRENINLKVELAHSEAKVKVLEEQIGFYESHPESANEFTEAFKEAEKD